MDICMELSETIVSVGWSDNYACVHIDILQLLRGAHSKPSCCRFTDCINQAVSRTVTTMVAKTGSECQKLEAHQLFVGK